MKNVDVFGKFLRKFPERLEMALSGSLMATMISFSVKSRTVSLRDFRGPVEKWKDEAFCERGDQKTFGDHAL